MEGEALEALDRRNGEYQKQLIQQPIAQDYHDVGKLEFIARKVPTTQNRTNNVQQQSIIEKAAEEEWERQRNALLGAETMRDFQESTESTEASRAQEILSKEKWDRFRSEEKAASIRDQQIIIQQAKEERRRIELEVERIWREKEEATKVQQLIAADEVVKHQAVILAQQVDRQRALDEQKSIARALRSKKATAKMEAARKVRAEELEARKMRRREAEEAWSAVVD